MLICADARCIPLADNSVQCAVTSPPYWGLRKYAGAQELVWGGAADCAHEWGETIPVIMIAGLHRLPANETGGTKKFTAMGSHGCYCQKCGAWRGAFGLEPTVEMYVAHTVEVLREVRRVLRDDGVLFLNLGDSYAGSMKGVSGDKAYGGAKQKTVRGSIGLPVQEWGALKPKDLCLIPMRVALAAQADGWWVRSAIIWAKPNPMPESVTDRPTDAYEHILMLTKSSRYFWDAEAVKEGGTGRNWLAAGGNLVGAGLHKAHDGYRDNGAGRGEEGQGSGRNLRNVWTFATQPYSGAHFATFPEELPRRCILAATSAKGACRFCGAPWERVVKSATQMNAESWKGSQFDTGKTAEHQGNRMQVRTGKNEQSGIRTMEGFNARWDEKEESGVELPHSIGWRPTCECRGQHGRTVACVVLDPFGGSGTTGRVATELNRRGVLLDLAYAHEYGPLAKKRNTNVQRMLNVEC